MELNEAVATDVIDERHDSDCYFCGQLQPDVRENDFEDSPEDDDGIFLDGGFVEDGLKFQNDASRLGRALNGTPSSKLLDITPEGLRSSVAAHHLIPGNAALRKSQLFESGEYLWADGSKKGNIMYNVNSSPNGWWLPGNYAMRPWGTLGAAFEAQRGHKAMEYVTKSIDAWKAQFHDSHENYSLFVLECLNQLYDKLEHNRLVVCPEAKEKPSRNPEEDQPIYVLVQRLHTISSRMKRMLVFPTTNWKRNVYTSTFVLEYMTVEKHRLNSGE